jgi:hypothetical protein
MGMLGNYPKPGLLAVYEAKFSPRGLPFRVIHCHFEVNATLHFVHEI